MRSTINLAASRLRRTDGPDWPTGTRRPHPPGKAERVGPAWCVICRWQGPSFEGADHCEAALCPSCGSIARDRWLHWGLVNQVRPRRRARVLETSPRLDDRYRQAMGRWFRYQSSDFDESLHRAVLRLDLQDIDLPDASVDVILSPHVLEHVPDTDRALAEIHRILAPGGQLLLQVPVLQGRTAPPATPEFHGDNTPVFWRFGYDLTARLRSAGFDTDLLVPDSFAERVARAEPWTGETSPEFDVPDMLAGAIAGDLLPTATAAEARLIGAAPDFMFCTWWCRRR